MKTCPKCSKTYEDAVVICPDDQSPLDDLIGKILAGRYRITDKIGEGGMGAIYKAVHIKMGRICAIKLLTSVSARDESAGARFNREARMASCIDNPHAVTIYDFGETDDGVLYLAMEFIEGEPLSRLLHRENVLDLDRVLNISSQISEALTAAHALGIVHRDLKPDNIMLTQKQGESDFVKVLDFGIAKSMAEEGPDHLTRTGFIVGTPAYMSPEQLAGDELDARSDVYSLAIIVYQMCSARLPFEGDTMQAMMMKRVISDPIPLQTVAPAVSDAVHRVVMRALTRDREDRTPSAHAFVTDLQAAQLGGTQVMGSVARATAGPVDGGFDHERVAAFDRSIESPPVKARATVREYGGQTIGPADLDSGPTVVDRVAVSTVPARSPRRLVLAGGGAILVVISLVLYLALKPSPDFTLSVTGALPDGADVFINTVRKGVTKDHRFELPGIPAGEAEIRITKSGFSDFKTTLVGSAGGRATVEAVLLPLEIDFNGAMVLIGAGKFTMGDDAGKPNERPAHSVPLADFYIDKFEVTNRQYKAFCEATGHVRPIVRMGEGTNYFDDNPDLPVLSVTIADATEYAKWAGKRLPTEQEWEKAASWDPGLQAKRKWTWGNEADPRKANVENPTNRPVFTPAGSEPNDKSAYGVFQMIGNVAEWVASPYEPYPNNTETDSKYGRGYWVVKGGSSMSRLDNARASTRVGLPETMDETTLSRSSVGFRCAASVDSNLIARLQTYMRK